MVAKAYFGESVTLVICDTFDATVQALIEGTADQGTSVKIEVALPSNSASAASSSLRKVMPSASPAFALRPFCH